jgi:hypothetical protein
MKKTNIHNRCAAVAVGSHSDCGLKQLLGMRVLLDIQKLSSVNEILKILKMPTWYVVTNINLPGMTAS